MSAPDAAARALAAAEIIAASFDTYLERFRDLTRGAQRHFAQRDWHAAQRDSAQRLDVYSATVNEALTAVRVLLAEAITDRVVWNAIRSAYASRIGERDDAELAETWFNSITRRIFHTIGVDPSIEFVAPVASRTPCVAPWTLTDTLRRDGSMLALVRGVLEAHAPGAPWDDLEEDASRVARAIVTHVGGLQVRGLETARAVFYRGKSAYIVGQLHTDGPPLPCVLALRHPEGCGVVVDAALLSEDEVSIVFSFARAYFHVEMDRPREMVAWLRSIMPRKPVAEIYNALGLNKHGKTELYRSLLAYLATTDDRFEIAPGQRGMVMCCFTLPGFDVVFKIIRDRFEPPKTVTHEEVREKYRLVFRHDRAGRLVDAQEFEHLAFDRARFAPELLEELLALAGETVRAEGDRVVIRHLYTERRLRPLDLYLREADPEAARDAVIDYGQVLRDLAATNIFPGDMLLKNFGVSRHGRLIFYDYDELCALEECRFRELPQPRDGGEETAAEPWFYVGERDIFPEEFRWFLGLKGELLQAFLAHHEELLGAEYWRHMQDIHRRGDVLDVYPYRASRRLRPRPAGVAIHEDPTAARSE